MSSSQSVAWVGVLGAALTWLAWAAPASADAAPKADASASPRAPDPPLDPLLAPPPAAPRILASWDEALGTIRRQSPDYLRTYDSVLRAEAQTRVALALLLPTVVGQGSFTHQFFTTEQSLGEGVITIPTQDVFAAGGTATLPVVNPRGWYGVKTADVAVDAAKSDLADKRRMIAQSLVSSMLATLAAERAAELNRVGLRAAIDRLGLAQTKVRVQAGTELDLDRAQQDADTARATVIAGDEALRQSREALGLALGSPVATAAPGTLDLGSFEKAVASTCHLNARIEQRADVVAARRRVELADRAIKDVYLQFSPTVALQSQLAWGTQVLYGPTTTMNLQAVVTVPIWDGGARYGYLRDARAAADQARQALEQARLSALVNVTQSRRAVTVTDDERDVAQRQRDRAIKVDQRTRDGYQVGVSTSLDLVTSAQALRVAEINLVRLEYQAARARVLAILSDAECVY